MKTHHERLDGVLSLNPIHSNPTPALVSEDQQLLEKVAMHDEAAFEVLYARYAAQVERYIRRRISRPELVDDVLQEVMLVLWQGTAQEPLRASLGSWLCGVARYKILQLLARSPAPVTAEHLDEPSETEEPEDALLRHDDDRILTREIHSLPHGERVAIQLLLQRYSYQDIAAATGDPVSTIRTRVARGCHRLRTRIAAMEHNAA